MCVVGLRHGSAYSVTRFRIFILHFHLLCVEATSRHYRLHLKTRTDIASVIITRCSYPATVIAFLCNMLLVEFCIGPTL